MPDSNHQAKDLPGTGSAAPVKAWQTSIETFFREDWSRLRSLILTLEEDLWLDNDRPSDIHDLSGGSSVQQQALAAEAPKIQSGAPVSQDRKGDAVTADRLSELAEHLENRLKIMNASKR